MTQVTRPVDASFYCCTSAEKNQNMLVRVALLEGNVSGQGDEVD